MDTKENIKIMQAYVDGKPIECLAKNETKWYRINKPNWNWADYAYRVKPEPKKLYAYQYANGAISFYDTETAETSGLRCSKYDITYP